jgi:RNA polymerase sigma factor (sigma-70 family)
LIIDDHALFGATLGLALVSKGLAAKHLPVIGGVQTILDQVDRVASGLVILDLYLGYTCGGRRIHGVELVAPLRARGWTVLVIADSEALSQAGAAVAAGATGVVSKSGSFEVLLEVVLSAASGKDVISERTRRDLLALHHKSQSQQQRLCQRLERLSPREREVLDLLARGYRISVIAERFVVSRNTVRSQVRAILTKLDVKSQLEAAAFLRDPQQSMESPPLLDEQNAGRDQCFQCGTDNENHWPWCVLNAHTSTRWRRRPVR